MTWNIDSTRRQLHRLGWSAAGVPLETLNGRKVWVVSVRRDHQSFSVQGDTPLAAWEAAARLAERLRNEQGSRPVVLQFPRPRPDHSRRAA
jgi:hypothetical protein